MACHEKVKKALTLFFSTTKLRSEKTFAREDVLEELVKIMLLKRGCDLLSDKCWLLALMF